MGKSPPRILASATCILLALVGCSDRTATLDGTVFLDGKPLTVKPSQRGMVVFRPVVGGATCSGLIGESGKYSISTGGESALIPGDYLVSVRVMELIPSLNESEAPTGKAITPAVYGDPLTSGLTYLVKRGGNVYDIKLKSTAGPAMIEQPAPDATDADQDDDSSTPADSEKPESDAKDAEGTGEEGSEDLDPPQTESLGLDRKGEADAS